MPRKQWAGWILVYREVFASGDFRPGPFNDILAYIWSMQQAAFEPHKRWFNGVQYSLEAGQFVTSQHEMSQEFGWTSKKVRLFIERMVRAERWAIGRAGKGAKSPTLITICNYDEIQRRNLVRGENGGRGAGLGGAQQWRSGDQEEKDDKKDKKNLKNPDRKTSYGKSKSACEDPRVDFNTFPQRASLDFPPLRPKAKIRWEV